MEEEVEAKTPEERGIGREDSVETDGELLDPHYIETNEPTTAPTDW